MSLQAKKCPRKVVWIELPSKGHEPVLLHEVVQQIDPKPSQIVVDCTIGRGGHAQALAARLGPNGLLIGLDTDPRNLQFAADQLRSLPCPTRLFHANFAELQEVLVQSGVGQVDGILADLGVSTNQLFDPSYGLSFSQDMHLDMRLDPRLTKT